MSPIAMLGVFAIGFAVILLWAIERGIVTLAISVVVQKCALAVIRFWCWRERRKAEKRIRREMVSHYRRVMGRRPTRAELRAEHELIRRYIVPPEPNRGPYGHANDQRTMKGPLPMPTQQANGPDPNCWKCYHPRESHHLDGRCTEISPFSGELKFDLPMPCECRNYYHPTKGDRS